MEIFLNISMWILGFAFMEFMAWFSHKYVMHGFLWVLHKDHHSPKKKRFEKNDWFAVIFAVPAMVAIMISIETQSSWLLYLGLGICGYGLAYFLFHDTLVHQRLKLFGKPKSAYLKGIMRAHHDHHTRAGVNYGFLFMVPWHYLRNK